MEEKDNQKLIEEIKRLSDLEGSPELVLMESIDELRGTTLETLDAVRELSEREVKEPEEMSPYFEQLGNQIELFRETVQNSTVDLSNIEIALSNVESAIKGLKFEVPDRTGAVIVALQSLKEAIEDIELETDLSETNELLKKIIDKKLPDEGGRVPVKLSDEDLKELTDAFGKGGKEGVQVLGGLRRDINLMTTGGVKINPATEETLTKVSDALFRYKLTDIDDTTSTEYYGYTDKDGNWYIKKVTDTAIRFVKGASSYTTNWSGRAALSYDYFYNTF